MVNGGVFPSKAEANACSDMFFLSKAEPVSWGELLFFQYFALTFLIATLLHKGIKSVCTSRK